uniref:Uncharacterized protein n=1 Tax=Candidatus Kentrum sp. LPFa TaxID=2126335 RepID=A0A450WFH8_9GAMM|nr:MAG: hypothetical protein BECKLPF1236A_GA0070988_101338 [Candidatus Kentron sp. LPFa]VFK31517.1 MAG: hypothetical protein BECKLPF1236C_GA0070990_101418 [Candidatus Kentron sp. LPFa]
MAQFPRDETGVLGLAQEIADGLAANRSTYPAPPVSVEEIEAATEDCNAARDAVQAAKAALDAAIKAKEKAFDTLEDKMKKEIRYAENTGQITTMQSLSSSAGVDARSPLRWKRRVR